MKIVIHQAMIYYCNLKILNKNKFIGVNLIKEKIKL